MNLLNVPPPEPPKAIKETLVAPTRLWTSAATPNTRAGVEFGPQKGSRFAISFHLFLNANKGRVIRRNKYCREPANRPTGGVWTETSTPDPGGSRREASPSNPLRGDFLRVEFLNSDRFDFHISQELLQKVRAPQGGRPH